MIVISQSATSTEITEKTCYATISNISTEKTQKIHTSVNTKDIML